MKDSLPNGLLDHWAIPLVPACVLSLNLIVAMGCGILPDSVDKPLSAWFDIGSGRFIGHSLGFLFGVTGTLFLFRRSWGIAALTGDISYFLLGLDDVCRGCIPSRTLPSFTILPVRRF